jgi:hypothetical protein
MPLGRSYHPQVVTIAIKIVEPPVFRAALQRIKEKLRMGVTENPEICRRSA